MLAAGRDLLQLEAGCRGVRRAHYAKIIGLAHVGGTRAHRSRPPNALCRFALAALPTSEAETQAIARVDTYLVPRLVQVSI
jgi:hypothetical protein